MQDKTHSPRIVLLLVLLPGVLGLHLFGVLGGDDHVHHPAGDLV